VIVTARSAINVTGFPFPATLVAASSQIAGTRQARYPFGKIITSQTSDSYPPEYRFERRGAFSRVSTQSAMTLLVPRHHPYICASFVGQAD
jgi:hypothetical protein